MIQLYATWPKSINQSINDDVHIWHIIDISEAQYKVHDVYSTLPRNGLLYWPAVFGHFWTHPEIIPVGQFFRLWILRSRSFQLIDWLIDHKSTLTWLVYWIRAARSVFTGGGANVTEHCGKIQYCPAVFGHFLDPLGNHPHRAIFPTVD